MIKVGNEEVRESKKEGVGKENRGIVKSFFFHLCLRLSCLLCHILSLLSVRENGDGIAAGKLGKLHCLSVPRRKPFTPTSKKTVAFRVKTTKTLN